MTANFPAALLMAAFELAVSSAHADPANRSEEGDRQVVTPRLQLLNGLIGLRPIGLRDPLEFGVGDRDGKFSPFTYGAYLDVYPLVHAPRVLAGVISSYKINLRARCPKTCAVGDEDFSRGSAALNGDITYRKPAPYLGLGFGDSLVDKPLYYGFDVGVLFENSQRNNLLSPGSSILNDSNGNLSGQFDTKGFGYSPVVQFNLGWRFF